MANKFIVFYKSLFPITTIIQALLFFTIVFLGFTAENGSYYILLNTFTGVITTFNYDYPFYESNGAIVILIQTLLLGILFLINYNFIKNPNENHKIVGLSGVTIYSLLIGLYIYYLVDWKDYWFGTESESSISASATFTNTTGELLFYFWLASLLFYFFPLIVNLLLSISQKTVVINNERFTNNQPNLSNSERLLSLKKLLDEGIISKEVFDEKSKKYIEEL
jgi:hypothetical protein